MASVPPAKPSKPSVILTALVIKTTVRMKSGMYKAPMSIDCGKPINSAAGIFMAVNPNL